MGLRHAETDRRTRSANVAGGAWALCESPRQQSPLPGPSPGLAFVCAVVLCVVRVRPIEQNQYYGRVENVC